MPTVAENTFLHDHKGPIANCTGTIGAITPSDTDELDSVCRVIYCGGTGGDVALVLVDGSEPPVMALAAGEKIDWLFVRQVKATGTTATGLVGFV